MKLVFWLSLAGILYTYAGYPVLIWVIARLRPRPWTIGPITPTVSVVLAVHNGMALLPRKIESVLSLDYPNIKEIIIVSDGSNDGTAEFLARQHDSRITPIILKEHGGKAVAVNAGMARATAEVILFIDLRQEIAPGAIQQLVSNFADPSVGCAAGELILRRGSQDVGSAAVSGAYWRYEKWIRTCESICGSPVGVSGCFYAIRRELAVPQPAGMILDDMFQPLSIIRQGYRSVLDQRAYVYDTLPAKIGEEFHRKVRTLAGNFQLFRLAPWTLTPHNPVLFQLVSHKVVRLAVPYLAVLLLVSTMALSGRSPVFLVFGALQTLFWTAAAADLCFKIPVLHRVAAPASALLVLKAAAVVGLYRFLFTRGPLWSIWTSNPPAERTATAETEKSGIPDPFPAGAGHDRV
ncbi:MAG: glycosyltransferase family 2 protein [Terracidiphilus sp.]|jgi:cellulose synthase/poly-beta-1,6-N-acetylglucosamine synthase-like glycosyltransferase